MKRTYAITFLFLAMAVAAAAQNTVKAQTTTEQLRAIDDPDVYRIYELVANSLSSSYKEQVPRTFIPIIQTTDPIPLSAQSPDCLKPATAEEHRLFDSALRDYEERNKSRWTIKQDGFKAAGLRVVPNLQDIGVFLSAVGFNSDKTAAVLYAFFRCEGNCGKGGWMTFVREGEGWRPVRVGKVVCLVVS